MVWMNAADLRMEELVAIREVQNLHSLLAEAEAHLRDVRQQIMDYYKNPDERE